MNLLTGIIPALVTPFGKDNRVDAPAIESLLARHIAEGVSGFYLCGSTAECHLMSADERMRVAEVACRHVDGKVPVIVHVGTISTDLAVSLARHAAKCGAAAVSAIPPFYYKFSLDEVKEYYRAIAAASDLPVVIYNFPAVTGVALSAENSGDLLSDPRIAGVKHTSTDVFGLQQMKNRFPRLALLNGYDENLLGGLSMGADGAIGSTYNFMAPRFIRLFEAFRGGDLATAMRLQAEANEIIAVLIRVGVYQGIKYLLRRQGIEVGVCRKPFRRLSRDEEHELDSVFEGV